MSARECNLYTYNDILVQLTILQHSLASHINYTYSVEHNKRLFRFKLCLYTCATRLGLYLGRPQACQYKTLTKGDIIKSNGGLVYSHYFYKVKT